MAATSAAATSASFERTLDIFARREDRLRNAFGRRGAPKRGVCGATTARDLKAKNIAALLERVCS